jgi:pilus assembly protein CpaF
VRSFEGFGADRNGSRRGTVVADGVDKPLVERFKKLLLEEVDLHELSKLEVSQRRIRLERVIAHLVSSEGVILTTRERNRLVRRVVDESVGLGILEPLLADASISEIMINGHDTIYVERYGRLERLRSGFTSNEQLLQTIDRIVSTVNRRVDESSPMVDARLPPSPRLPRGARVNVVLPPLALGGPTVTIRLFPKALGMTDLLQYRSIDAVTAELLAACVRARLNIIVSGGTASGKTTMLNALSEFVPGHERIVTVEDAAELVLVQEHTVRLETRPANVEGSGQVSIRDLVRNSLRMRPDRIIVGEVRGGEALDMLQAMNTGHEGSLATVHANSTDDALSRLETLATMSDVELPYAAVHDQVNGAIDIVVQLLRHADGTRRTVAVDYLTSRRREDFRLARIMHFDPHAGEDRRGDFVRHPIPRVLAEKLSQRDERLPTGFTVADGDGEEGGGVTWSD